MSTTDLECFSVIINRDFHRQLCLTAVHIPPSAALNNALEHLKQLGIFVKNKDLYWIMGDDFNNDLNSKNRDSNKISNIYAKTTTCIKQVGEQHTPVEVLGQCLSSDQKVTTKS